MLKTTVSMGNSISAATKAKVQGMLKWRDDSFGSLGVLDSLLLMDIEYMNAEWPASPIQSDECFIFTRLGPRMRRYRLRA